MESLRNCVPFEMSFAHSLLCCDVWAMDVIQEWMLSPALQPYLPTSQLKGSASSMTLHSWLVTKELKLLGHCGIAHLRLYISDCGELKVTKQSLSPPSLPWRYALIFLCHFITRILSLYSLSCIYSFCYQLKRSDKRLYSINILWVLSSSLCNSLNS